MPAAKGSARTPLGPILNFFSTNTYDEIQQDVKITTEAALGLIGGTMGLLTGFSILSRVEITYHAVMFCMPKQKVSNCQIPISAS